MKILYLSTGFSLLFRGGITNYIRMLATVQKNEYDVCVMGERDEKNMNLIIFNMNNNI